MLNVVNHFSVQEAHNLLCIPCMNIMLNYVHDTYVCLLSDVFFLTVLDTAGQEVCLLYHYCIQCQGKPLSWGPFS